MNIVKNARKKLKFTQKNLAIKCNIKQSYISQVENYKKIPCLNIILKLSNNLKVCPLLILQKYLCKNCKLKEICMIKIIIVKK